MTLVGLRVAARAKFERADRMFFDREGLEMATRQPVADYRAQRFRAFGSIVDLCCGIGGDSISLGRNARVCAVDLDRARLEMARLNCAAAEVDADFVQADAEHFEPTGEAVFLDPSRRLSGRGGGARIRATAAYSPPLSIIAAIRARISAVAIKVAPGVPEEELPADGEVEFISADGQCREGVIYYGDLVTAARRATVLPGPHSLVGADGEAVAVAPLGAYIYDPDPAVVRSHLIDPLARRLSAWKLDPQIAYLSGDKAVKTPFARCYQVLHWLPFNLKSLRRHLLKEGLRPTTIMKRRFPIQPMELQRLLRLQGAGHPVTLIATRIDERAVVAVCEPVPF
jgi:SAM-dependent methyltransferase